MPKTTRLGFADPEPGCEDTFSAVSNMVIMATRTLTRLEGCPNCRNAD